MSDKPNLENTPLRRTKQLKVNEPAVQVEKIELQVAKPQKQKNKAVVSSKEKKGSDIVDTALVIAANKPVQEGASKKNKTFSMHKADHDPRAAALVCLTRVLEQGHMAQEALDTIISSPRMMPTDKRLCTELVYGVLRHYTRLRWFAERALEKPEKLPGEMLLAVVLALYEMAFLRIPHHASLGWAVSHIRNRFGLAMSRVCNGTLRTLQRRLRDFHRPEFYSSNCANELQAKSIMYSCPLWLVEMWHTAYGEEQATLFLQNCVEAAPSGLRFNQQKTGWKELLQEVLQTPVAAKKASKHLAKYAQKTVENSEEQLPTEEGALGEEPKQAIVVGQAGLAFAGSLPWQGRSLERQGLASRQSMASYAALLAFDPRNWKHPIWDCCAGRGGKSLGLLEMNIKVRLCTDPSKARLRGFAEEYLRLGLETPPCPILGVVSATTAFQQEAFEVVTLNPESINKLDISQKFSAELNLPEKFGTILIDAPCSGLGTLSRHPEIKYRRTEQDIAGLIVTQKAILDAAAFKLAVGGSIIYLTCTLNPAENQEQVASFLARYPEFKLLESFETDATSPLKEFFYGARLQKQN